MGGVCTDVLMIEKEVVKQVDIERSSEQEHILRCDKRGRITIPKTVRNRHGIDTTDENTEVWAEITLHSLEVRDDSEGGDSA